MQVIPNILHRELTHFLPVLAVAVVDRKERSSRVLAVGLDDAAMAVAVPVLLAAEGTESARVAALASALHPHCSPSFQSSLLLGLACSAASYKPGAWGGSVRSRLMQKQRTVPSASGAYPLLDARASRDPAGSTLWQTALSPEFAPGAAMPQ